MVKLDELLNGYRITTIVVTPTKTAMIMAYSDEKNEWVIAEVTEQSLKYREWLQGHYFRAYYDAFHKLCKMVNGDTK